MIIKNDWILILFITISYNNALQLATGIKSNIILSLSKLFKWNSYIISSVIISFGVIILSISSIDKKYGIIGSNEIIWREDCASL